VVVFSNALLSVETWSNVMFLKMIKPAFKPFRMASMVFTYLLGAGLVQYVREMRSWRGFFQGLVFLIFLMFSIELMRLLTGLTDPKQWPSGTALSLIKQIRWMIALLSAAFLTVVFTILIGWILEGVFWQGLVSLLLTLGVAGGGYFLTGKLENLRPYQIFTELILFVVIPPAIAFFLQSEDFHLFLTLIMICLVPPYIAYRLLSQLKQYYDSTRNGERTFVVEIGWEKAMVWHNLMLLLTYVLFALVTVLGLPMFLIWPVFLTFLIALLEIYLMENVRRGGKVLWRVMQAATLSVYFIPIYLIGFAFWIR